MIAADAGAIPEITGQAAILFNPHDPQELAQAILKVASEPDVRRRLVDLGVMRAREFTWERAARETLEVFGELA